MSGIASRGTWLDKTQLYVNAANHMLIAVVAFYTTWLCLIDGPGTYVWHTWLCTIGYNVLMCESFMSLYNRNSWSSLHGRRTRNNIHWILQAIGCSFAVAGMVILYLNRGFRIRSMHAKLGFGSNVLIIIGVINGSSAIWAAELRRLVKPVYSKLFHNLTGSLCFTMGMASLYYGFNLGPFRTNSTPTTIVTMQVICAITIVLSMFGALTSLCNQVMDSLPWLFKHFKKEEQFGDDVNTSEKVTGKA